MTSSRYAQSGATLLVTLIALIIVTLLALAAIKASSINLKISGNVQAAGEAEAAAQFAIDGMIADITKFTNPPTGTTPVSVTMGGKTYDVVLQPPSCLRSVTAPGYSLLYSSPPVDQVWNFVATATDSISGASVTLNQGIKVRMPVGTPCPN
jgi:Tfp pilus assembly protein PilX